MQRSSAVLLKKQRYRFSQIVNFSARMRRLACSEWELLPSCRSYPQNIYLHNFFVTQLFRKASCLESTVIISGLLKKLVAVYDS